MSETASAPVDGGVGSGAPAASEGAAAQVLDAVVPAVDAAAAPAPVVEDRSEENRALLARERERRRLAKEREAIETAKREAEAARDEAKRLSSERNSEADQMAALLRQAKGNPAKFEALLEATGLSLDDYVRFKVSGGEVTPEQQIKGLDAALRDEIKQAREELDALKRERDEERQTREQQSQAQQREQALSYFATEIDKTLKADAKKYELTIKAGDEGEVLKLIDGAWNQKKIALTPAQAADMIEQHHRKMASIYRETEFLKSQYAPQSTAAPEAPPKAATPAKTSDAKRPASPAAMTNQTVTSPAAPDDDAPSTLSREEFIERIAKDRVRNARKTAATPK